MNINPKRLLYWAPRLLSILFALFISVFALDVFSEGYTFWEAVLALFMHLVPTFIIVVATVIAWRSERVGAALFFILAMLFLGISRGEGWIIAAPLFLLAVLYFFGWLANNQQKKPA